MRILHRSPTSPSPSQSSSIASSPPPLSADARSCPTLPINEQPPPIAVRSCPSLPLSEDPVEQPGLLKRASHPPFPRLPPLNLANLSEPCVDDVRTARRRVQSLSTSLSRFRPYLLVCSDAVARDLSMLKRAGVTHIVNLAGVGSVNWHANEFEYLNLVVRDDAGAAKEMRAALMSVARFIDSARKEKGIVMVHCRQGISRSVTAALAYVMMREGSSLDDTMREMRVCRPIANPNTGFWDMLRDFESWMLGRGRARVMAIRSLGANTRGAVEAGMEEANKSQALILQRKEWGGMVVWIGNSCSEEVYREAVRLGGDLSRQEQVDAARRGREARGLTILKQGADHSVEEEMKRIIGV